MNWTAETFRTQVVHPALNSIALYSPAAEQLVLGTAIQESRLLYVEQIGGGPALGYFQMEPATHDDIWNNFLKYRPILAGKVSSLLSSDEIKDKCAALRTNNVYAAAMCRVDYFRQKPPLPSANDIKAMAQYWKTYYNTGGGGGTVDEFMLNWNRFTAPPQRTN